MKHKTLVASLFFLIVMFLINNVNATTTLITKNTYTYSSSTYYSTGTMTSNIGQVMNYPEQIMNDKYNYSIQLYCEVTYYCYYSNESEPVPVYTFLDKYGKVYTQYDVVNSSETITAYNETSFQNLTIFSYESFVVTDVTSTYLRIQTYFYLNHSISYIVTMTAIILVEYQFDLMEELIDASTNMLLTAIPFATAVMFAEKLNRKSLYLIALVYFVFGLTEWMNYLIGVFLFIFAYMLNKE